MAGRRPRVQVRFVQPDEPQERQQQQVIEAPPEPPTAASAAGSVIPVAEKAGDKVFFDENNPSVLRAADVTPLPADGIVSKGDPPFGQTYVVQMLRNRAVIAADAVYQFISDLRGMIGLTQTPWAGSAPGGQVISLAFENAFTNLAALANTSIKPILGEAFVTGIADETRDRLTEGLAAMREAAAARVGMDEEAKAVATDLFGNVHARKELELLERQIKLVKAASDLPDDRVGATVNRALGVANIGGTGGVSVTPVAPPPPGYALPGAPAPPPHGAPAPLPPGAPAPLPKGSPAMVATPSSLAKRAEEKFQALTTLATNPEIVLYRAMEEGRVNEAWLKAYDRLYYKDRGEDKLGKLAKFTEAVRNIERMLSAAGSAQGKFSPASFMQFHMQAENLGMLFIEDKVRAAIITAYDDVKKIALVQHVPLVDWMVQQDVRVSFMRLCALEYNDPIGRSYAARGSTNTQRESNARDRGLLLRLLGTAQYVGDKLVLGQTYDPGAALECARREAERRRYFEETGVYHTGRIDVTKLPKGPKGSLADERRRKKEENDAKLAHSMLFS